MTAPPSEVWRFAENLIASDAGFLRQDATNSPLVKNTLKSDCSATGVL
jgi:hypothetical protein